MISKLLIAFVLMALCVTIHAMGMALLLRWMKRRPEPVERILSASWLLIRVAGWIILMHLLQIVVWGVFYVCSDGMPSFQSAVYFSAVTYTTTGYGDLVLPQAWRIVGGVEALTGILMCGFSTGLFFAVVTRIFGARLSLDAT